MQIVELSLDHYNFFCPATGIQIIGEDYPCNDDAPSLMGYWIDQALDLPYFNSKELEEAWTEFCNDHAKKNHGLYPDLDDLENFLTGYPAGSWVVFSITTCGIACGPVSMTVWFVIDMNTELVNDEDEEAGSEE